MFWAKLATAPQRLLVSAHCMCHSNRKRQDGSISSWQRRTAIIWAAQEKMTPESSLAEPRNLLQRVVTLCVLHDAYMRNQMSGLCVVHQCSISVSLTLARRVTYTSSKLQSGPVSG